MTQGKLMLSIYFVVIHKQLRESSSTDIPHNCLLVRWSDHVTSNVAGALICCCFGAQCMGSCDCTVHGVLKLVEASCLQNKGVKTLSHHRHKDVTANDVWCENSDINKILNVINLEICPSNQKIVRDFMTLPFRLMAAFPDTTSVEQLWSCEATTFTEIWNECCF